MSVDRFVGQNARKTKVPQLHIVADVEKYIPRFNVSVQNFAVFALVALLQGQNYLHEYLPDHVFSDVVLLGPALLDELRHVSVLAVLHDNVQAFRLFIHDLVEVLNDVRVAQLRKDVHFGHHLVLLALAHASVVEFFPNERLAVALAPDLVNRAVAAWT